MRLSRAVGGALSLLLLSSAAAAQEWRSQAAHLGTTARVLLIGTRPEDEDNGLMVWLSLERHVETTYLSLTRGESGINAIGSEHQTPLAVVRTAELLEERKRDGAHQYFTRAYDFGPTDADSTVNAAWPHDVLLADVVSIVRAFRPNVIIALTHADDRDATRRITARVTAEAFALAGDTARMPRRLTSHLPAWRVDRLFTRVDRQPVGDATGIAIDIGEFDRARGRSYAELGAEVRQLQRTQGRPAAPALGAHLRWLRLDSTRTGRDPTLFGAVDTSLARFAEELPHDAHPQLDTLRALIAAAAAVATNGTSDSLAATLARVIRRTSDVRLTLPCDDLAGVPLCDAAMGDLAVSLNRIHDVATHAMLDAASVVVDGTVARELVAAGDSVMATVTIYNGGDQPVTVRRIAVGTEAHLTTVLHDAAIVVPPDQTAHWTTPLHVVSPNYHWWQMNGLQDGTYLHALHGPIVPQLIGGEDRIRLSSAEATLVVGDVDVPVIAAPLVYRSVLTLRDDARHPLAAVPPTSVLLDRTAEYERAGLKIDRLFRVYVASAQSAANTLSVTLRLPRGLSTDSMTRIVTLPPFGSRNVFFRLRGVLHAGSDTIFATARSVPSGIVSQGRSTTRLDAPRDVFTGIVTHDYPHIPSQQFVRFANDRLEAVDARAPARLSVLYVKGTEDVQRLLADLQLKVQTLDPARVSAIDLSGFTTVLIGRGALAEGALDGALPALQSFLRRGGTIVVVAGGSEVARSGLFPYAITFDSNPGVIRDPATPLRAMDVHASLLRWPNAIGAADFEGWMGTRAAGLPNGFDSRYDSPLSIGAAADTATSGALLIARVGRGVIVYTGLSIDEQLTAIHPGAARLIINLLSAGLASHPTN